MTTAITSPTPRARRWRRSLALTIAMMLPAGLALAAPSASSMPEVTVTAQWGGASAVAGAGAPTRLAGESSAAGAPFQLTVDCGGAPCSGLDLAEISADLGDGTRVIVDLDQGITTTLDQDGSRQESGASSTITHRYVTAGQYAVQVQVIGRLSGGSGLSHHATRELTLVAAAPSGGLADLADLDARSGLLHLRAAGLLPTCGTAVAGLHAVPTSRTGREMVCAAPSGSFLAPPTGDVMTGVAENGVTGADCYDRFYVCGFDATQFGLPLGGSPYDICTVDLCALTEVQVTLTPTVTSLRYDQSRCGDGWTADPAAGSWTIQAGTKPGCVTRAELFTALVGLVDGAGSVRATDGSVTCTDSGSYTTEQLYPLLRAATLGIPALTAEHPHQTPTLCALGRVAHRDEAYAALGALLGASGDPAATGLVDLADLHLGYPPLNLAGGEALPSPMPQHDDLLIAGALESGVPLPADTTCYDLVQSPCLKGDEPLTWSEFGRLIAPLLPDAG